MPREKGKRARQTGKDALEYEETEIDRVEMGWKKGTRIKNWQERKVGIQISQADC